MPPSPPLLAPLLHLQYQAYGESGMTVLEELIDAAFRACDVGHAQGQQRVTGAALLTRSGKMCVVVENEGLLSACKISTIVRVSFFYF